MVVEKELTGTQLIADNNFLSDFLQVYGVESIPRFILIDPEGKIVESKAPNPSDPKLIELFDTIKYFIKLCFSWLSFFELYQFNFIMLYKYFELFFV